MKDVKGFLSDKEAKKLQELFLKVHHLGSVLEIGTYMGHSVTYMLQSNPNLEITCIDIDNTYSKPSIDCINEHFKDSPNVKFIHGDSMIEIKKLIKNNQKYDFFHIDGTHSDDQVFEEFQLIKELNSEKDILKVLFDDQISIPKTQNNIDNNYNIIEKVKPKCKFNNVYYKLKL